MIQKNRASDVQALIQNFKQVENATTSAINAEGSAMQEYSIHMDTIQASLNTLSSTWQDFSNIFLNSKFLKGGVDTLSTLLDLFGKLIDKVGLLPTLLTGLSAFGTSKNIGFFKLIDDDATKSGKRMLGIFAELKNNIKTLDSSMKTTFSYSNDFSKRLNNDIASLIKYKSLYNSGLSKDVAYDSSMLDSSFNAKEFAKEYDVASMSVKQFELNQKQAEISLMASNKSLQSTKILIDEYQGGLKNCGMSQEQFLSAIQSTNPQLFNYMSGIKNTDASLKGYTTSLITTKVATIGLQMATMALNMAITMGLSVAISGLMSMISELYVSKKEAMQQTEEELQKIEQQVKKYKEQSDSIYELISKYKELKSSGDNSPKTRSEIVDIQRQIVGLVGKEAYNLDLVGGKLDDNLSKLKEYQKILTKKETKSLYNKLTKQQEKNKNERNNTKLSTFNTGYDVTGELGYDDYRILKKSKIKFNSESYTNRNKVGFASDVNEFTNEKIKTTADALKYYQQVRKEWIETYSEDKKTSKANAEYELGSNQLFSNLDKKIQELEEKANEELQLSQDYLTSKSDELSKYDKDLQKIKVDSADDYQKYIDKFKKKILSDKNVNKLIKDGILSKKDINKFVEDYVSGLDKIGAYKNQWQKKYKNIETNVAFSQEGLDKAKENFDAFYKSIEESMSDTGLSSETINNIQAIYGELDGYDASKLFERTAIGIRLNRTELEKLQKQYDYQNKSAIHSNLRDLVIEYEDLENELNRCTTAKEREKIQSQMDSKQDEIDEVRQLASEYDALTSKHYEWLKALSTPNEGDNYDSFVSNLDKVKELYNKGLIGTDDFQKSVQMMTYEDLSGKTAEEYVKVYQDKLPTIKKFFKEGTSGCENFLKAIQNLNKDWAKQNKDGSWELNFESDKLAKEMGISVDLVEYFIGKLKDFGFTYENEVENLSLDKLAKDANKFLNEEKETKIKFNFDTKNIKDANAEIEKAQKLLDSYKNEDGVLDLRVKGASESQTILTALIKNRQKLSQPAIMDIKLNKDELETDYGHTVTLLQNLQKYADTLEVKIKTGQDTSDTKTKIQDTIKELNKLPEEVKTSIGFNEEEVKKKLSNIANVEADVELNENDIDTIRKTIASVEPEVLAKVDKTEIKKFKKDNIDKEADVLFDLKKTKVLKDFLDSTPVVEGEVRFTTTTPPKTNKSSDEKPSSSRSNPVNKDKKNGKSGADGTATSLVSGTAFANGKSGNWSVGTSGKALVGEQGEELRVRNGKWELIGSDSAEFVDVQPNDIIFNNEQVKQLFKYGKIINGKSRGRALASGTAFSDGTLSGNAFADGLNRLKGKIISGGTTKKKTNSKSKSSSKSKSKSSSSKSDEAKETFDWIEIAIERIENAISDLDKIADSVYYNFSTRNSKLKKEYSEVKKEISLQEKAYTRYMKQANSVGLSSKYKKLVQNGKIDISTIKDDKLKEKINSYKEWYDKAQNVKDAIADLKLEMKNLRKEMFDLTATDYDNFVGRLEKQKTLIDNYISRSESKGLTISTKYYDALINIENTSLTKLKSERTALIKALNNAVKSGDVAVYSDAWYEMQGKIDDVNESVQMCTNNIIEFQNEIRQIKWDNFDYLHETISQITDESDFLVSLFENKDLFDDKGNITNIGTSTLGLYGMDYNVLMQQAQSYAREIESLNKEIAKTPNDKNLIARRNELIKSQQDMILNAMSEKKAMIDLVRDGYDLQLDSLQDLIDKYNEALESERDLYDYQKKVKDQTKEVANLEKQLSAYQGDNSEETKAKVQQLKISLEEAKEDLQETQYDRYIQNQKDLLENIYKEYEDIINSKFDDVDVLFSELISNVNSNSTTINDTLISESEKVGYNLTDSIESIWGDSGTVLSDFSNGFNEFSGKFDTYVQNGTNNIESWLGTINSNLVAMINNGNATATNEVNKATTTKYTAKGTTTSSSSSSSSSSKSKTSSSSSKSKTTTSSKSKTAGYISSLKPLITSSSSSSYIKKVQTALKALGFKGKNGKSLTIDGIWGTNTDYAVKSFQKSSKYGGSITADGKIGKNTKAKFKKAGYRKGVFNLNKNELAWTQEDNKPEIIVRKSDGAILTPLSKGDSVLNNNATSNIWDMANDPTKFIKDNLSSNLDISNGNNNISNNTVQNDINMNITLPNVKNYNEFVNQLQKDSKFERMIQDMTVNQLSGKSSLNKFRYKFK